MPIDLLRRNIVRDSALIVVGAVIYAIGLNCFEVPNGLAAGGAAGLATIMRAVFLRYGYSVPIGAQVLCINVLLLAVVLRQGGLRYAARTIIGIIASTLAIDLLAPFLPELGDGDLILCSLWGGAVCGAGIGLIFRAGGNTGGTDVVAQIVARKTQLSVGTASMLADMAVVALSVFVFGIEKALYATIAMVLGSKVVDVVVDGFAGERAAIIISDHSEELIRSISLELHRGVTELSSRKAFSKVDRPVLYVVIDRSQTSLLKALVAEVDPHSVVVISEVYEAFGKGFQSLES